MLEALIGAVATVAVGVLAWVQWHFSRRAENQRHQADQQAAARQRDAEMTQWGFDVIAMMAELETVCAPIATDTQYSNREIETLSHRASALVDQGRLFFPNVSSDGDDEGIRVKVLDEVLRACYVARHIAAGKDADRSTLREHVWQARKKFVLGLQAEMGQSLRRVGQEHMGAGVSANLDRWAPPTRKLNLPPP